jgi:hypothetical protein
MTKDLSQLTPEQLMDLAKNPIKETRKTKFSPVKEFIVSAGITAGDYPIPGLIVYDRYRSWCKSYSITPITNYSFFLEFKLHFTRKVKVDGKYYLLNPEGFDLSPQHLSKLRSEHRKRTSYGSSKKKKSKEKSK